MKTPPAGFSAPVVETTAAGLNFLPGIGNAYLANKGAGGMQWAVGAGNLLLWPISPLWSVPEGHVDARTMNRRALVAYWNEHPDLAENPLRADTEKVLGGATAVPLVVAPSAVVDVPPPAAPFEIETVQPYSHGRAVYRVTIRDASRTAFDVERLVRPDIERILRAAFAAETPGVSESSIRAYAVPDFGSDRTLLFTGTVFSLEPTADGWEFDSASHRGRIRLRVLGNMSPEEAKRWARENISAIVSEKNIALEAGKAPPPGATYRSLGETFDDGILTIEFSAEL